MRAPLTENDDGLHFSDRHPGTDSISLFLVLYLVILAFFIVLVSMSSFEEGKAQAAIESVTTTFSSTLTPSTLPSPLSETHGSWRFGRAFQEDISRVFETTLRVADVRIIELGREMRVTFSSDALFEPGTWRLRAERLALLDRLVTAISQRVAAGRFALEFAIGSSRLASDTVAPAADQPALRATAFARAMVARGAPDALLAIALVPGDPATTVMTFRWRSYADEGAEPALP